MHSFIEESPLKDALVCKDTNNNLQTTLDCEPTDQQSFLHAESDHYRSFSYNCLLKNINCMLHIYELYVLQKENTKGTVQLSNKTSGKEI